MRYNKHWPLLSFPSTDVTQVRGIINVCKRVKPKLAAFPCLVYNWSTTKRWPLPGQVHGYRHLSNKQVEGTVWQHSVTSKMHEFWRVRLRNVAQSLHAPQIRDFCLRLWMKSRYMRVLRPAWFRLVSSRWNYTSYMRSVDRGSTVVKVLRYKSEGRWFDSRWCHWNFSLT